VLAIVFRFVSRYDYLCLLMCRFLQLGCLQVYRSACLSENCDVFMCFWSIITIRF